MSESTRYVKHNYVAFDQGLGMFRCYWQRLASDWGVAAGDGRKRSERGLVLWECLPVPEGARQIGLGREPGIAKEGQAASRHGEAGININYGYCAVEPGTNATFLIFGGAEADKAT
jgi:hypothetical protein